MHGRPGFTAIAYATQRMLWRTAASARIASRRPPRLPSKNAPATTRPISESSTITPVVTAELHELLEKCHYNVCCLPAAHALTDNNCDNVVGVFGGRCSRRCVWCGCRWSHSCLGCCRAQQPSLSSLDVPQLAAPLRSGRQLAVLQSAFQRLGHSHLQLPRLGCCHQTADQEKDGCGAPSEERPSHGGPGVSSRAARMKR
jgi:hypothetical protein